MSYQTLLGGELHVFNSLTTLLAKANEEKSGDRRAGLAATSERERAAAKLTLADVRLSDIVDQPLIEDEVSVAILDDLDRVAFDAAIGSLAVGELREWVLDPSFAASWAARGLHRLVTPEIAAAVAKVMSNLDLVAAAAPLRVVTRCRTTLGEPGVFASRLQPNHPTDDPRGIAVSVLDGLLLGSGDAMLGVNPANDSVESVASTLGLLRAIIDRLDVPTQSCVLAHVTTQLQALEAGAELDLMFQSVAGTERANSAFGINLALLAEAQEATLAHHAVHGRDTTDMNVTYFETGQGSALSSDAHAGIDQVTCEARAQGVARLFDPFLVNSVVGFIGPEYLADSAQISRAGLEDHFMGKLMGLPMGCDVCFTNHVDADHNSNDSLLMQLALAGANFVMGVPSGDDVMLSYQSTSFHDVATVRTLTGTRPTPEFSAWFVDRGLDRAVTATHAEDAVRALTGQLLSIGGLG